jgi:hypothetical protein
VTTAPNLFPRLSSFAISARNKMPPNAPQCTQIHREKRDSQNEPTMGRSGAFGCIPAHRPAQHVDTGLRQLTPVNPGLPPHVIGRNEPTAAHVGKFRRIVRAPGTIATSGIPTAPRRPRPAHPAKLHFLKLSLCRGSRGICRRPIHIACHVPGRDRTPGGCLTRTAAAGLVGAIGCRRGARSVDVRGRADFTGVSFHERHCTTR